MKQIFPLACLMMLLASCSPVGLAMGAGATVGTAAAKEGGISRAYQDTRIRAEINELWLRHDFSMFRKVGLTVDQGRVLLTGIVQNPEHRVEAVRLAWKPRGVQQVINEIRVADSEGITGFARDKWITTRLRTAITFDSKIQSINYSIDTVQGTVYLMGVARNQAELNRVIGTARTIPDVKRVVSYVKLASDDVGPTPDPGMAASGPPPGASYDPGPPPPDSAYGNTQYAPPNNMQVQGVEAEPLDSGPASWNSDPSLPP